MKILRGCLLVICILTSMIVVCADTMLDNGMIFDISFYKNAVDVNNSIDRVIEGTVVGNAVIKNPTEVNTENTEFIMAAYRDNKMFAITRAKPNFADAVGETLFSDDFETAFDSGKYTTAASAEKRYKIEAPAPLPGSTGINYALKMNDIVKLEKVFNEDLTGSVEGWFYDDASTARGAIAIKGKWGDSNINATIYAGKVQAAAGALDKYDVRINAGAANGPESVYTLSPFNRTYGKWHKIKFEVDSSGYKVYIDTILIKQGTEIKSFNSVWLGTNSWSGATGFIDGISVKSEPSLQTSLSLDGIEHGDTIKCLTWKDIKGMKPLTTIKTLETIGEKPPAVLRYESFESTTYKYSNVGSPKVKGDGWYNLPEEGALAVTTNTARSGASALKMYTKGAAQSGYSSYLPIDATGYYKISVSFFYNYVKAKTTRDSWFDVTYDGVNYETLQTFKHEDGSTDGWVKSEFNLSVLAANNPKLEIRFRTSNIVSDAYYMIDDMTISGTPLPEIDLEAPTAPTNLVANVTTQRTTRLNWTQSSDNVCISGYKIYRNDEIIPITTSFSSACIVKNIGAGTNKFYVTALDFAGNESEASNYITVTAMPAIQDNSLPLVDEDFELRFDGEDSPLLTRFEVTGTNTENAVALQIEENNKLKLTDNNSGNVIVSKLISEQGLADFAVVKFKIMTETIGNVNIGLFAGNREVTRLLVDNGKMALLSVGNVKTPLGGDLVSGSWYNVLLHLDIVSGNVSAYIDGELMTTVPFIQQVDTIDWFRLYTNGTGNSVTYFDDLKIYGYDLLADTTPPEMTLLTKSDITSDSVKLSWNAATDASGIDFYSIYKDDIKVDVSIAKDNEIYSALLEGLLPGQSYAFKVTATDMAGNTSAMSNAVTVNTLTAPTTPKLSLMSFTEESAALHWTESLDDKEVTEYKIYESGLEIISDQYQSGSGIAAVISGLVPGKEYIFTVKAFDNDGEFSLESNAVVVFTDKTPPSMPVLLNIEDDDINGEDVLIRWEPSVDNFGISEYRIYTNNILYKNPEYLLVDGRYECTVSDLTMSTMYNFKVAAVDKGGNITDSNTISITTKSLPYNKENFHIYLFIGQSNMCGRANIEAQDKFPISRAFLFDGIGWVNATAPCNRFTPFESASPQKLNPTYTFLQRATEVNPDIGFGAIVMAKGGSSIEQWDSIPDNNTGDFFPQTVERCREAMKYGTLKGILWHQGETGASSAGYEAKLIPLVEDLRAAISQGEDYAYAYDVPFIAGETYYAMDSYNRKPVNDEIASAKSKILNYDYVNSIGTSVIDRTTHFDSKSQRLLGYRYAEKINKMVYGLPNDEIAPTAPTGLHAVSKTSNSITLEWNEATDNVGVWGYEIFINGSEKTGFISPQNSCVITGLTPEASVPLNSNTEYTFRVRAYDRMGNVSLKSDLFSVKTD